MIKEGGVARTDVRSLHCGCLKSGQTDPELAELNLSTLPKDSFHSKVSDGRFAIVPKAISYAIPQPFLR